MGTQAAVICASIILVAFFFSNVVTNLKRLGVASGFEFLGRKAGFSVIQSLLPYTEQSTYLKLFFVGLFNTLLVSSLGIFLATLIGFSIGIMRLTRHPIMSRLASVFVEIIRNIPLLLQILVWYFLLLEVLPSPRSSLEWMQSVFLNNRGLYFPFPVITTTGLGLSWPVLEGFNFVGGICLIPELCALLLALSLYTAAFISEIVRAGIQGVQTGQIEAAKAIGLNSYQAMRFVILPQSFRIVIPLTSQYLNLTKNSSLAAAIGYPDLVAVFAGTALNQTGQAIETIAMTMAVYLSLSLGTSLVMNWFNRKYAL